MGCPPAHLPLPSALCVRVVTPCWLLLLQALKDYIQADRPFFGICLGLQLLFEGSEENGGCQGMGLIPGAVTHFDVTKGLPVPHIGWNDLLQK